MIICICHNVNSQQIRSAVRDGAQTFDQVRQQTLAATGCGKCQFKLNSVMQDELAQLAAQGNFYEVQSA